MDKSRYVLGGAEWINLVNTINKRQVDMLDDRLKTVQWLEANNLLRESDAQALQNEELFHSLLGRLHSLRHLCKGILTDLEQQGKPSSHAANQLQKLVEQVNVRLTLVPSEGNLHLVCEGTTMEDHVLYKIAQSITHSLERVPVDRIRKCEHEQCILYFIDTSKSGKRRWCSMETCGNRQKAAEFYARKKQK